MKKLEIHLKGELGEISIGSMTRYKVEESNTPFDIQKTIDSEDVLSSLKDNEIILTKDIPAKDFNPANIYFKEREKYQH